MIPVSTMRGREVALFGLGGSGMATVRALVAGGAIVTAWDDNPASVDRAAAEGIGTGDLRDADWSRFAALVLAPGVPLTHPKPHWTVDLARAGGVEVIGDVELFCRERAATCPDAPFVAITGTNGKSTTTALVAHILREVRRDVQMGGNIGVPILALEPPATDRIHVIECSSYQIDLAPGLNPSVGVLLNVTPDHLDRHGSFKRYTKIKERLVANSRTAVVAIDDEVPRTIAKRLSTDRRERANGFMAVAAWDLWDSVPPIDIAVTSEGFIEEYWGGLIRRDRFGPIAEVPSLRGRHNAQNAAAAMAVGLALKLNPDDFVEGFHTFPGLAHRMEQVADANGIIFVNDSKATNADAASPALSSFPCVRWIAGGLPKDGGIEPLRPLFHHVERAYLIGEAAPAFAATLGDTVPYEISGTLDEAVKHAARDAADAGGGVVLFSPAAASFDQFRNFEERGNAFKAAVSSLNLALED